MQLGLPLGFTALLVATLAAADAALVSTSAALLWELQEVVVSEYVDHVISLHYVSEPAAADCENGPKVMKLILTVL